MFKVNKFDWSRFERKEVFYYLNAWFKKYSLPGDCKNAIGIHRRGALKEKTFQEFDGHLLRLVHMRAGEDKANSSLTGRIKRALNKAIIKKYCDTLVYP